MVKLRHRWRLENLDRLQLPPGPRKWPMVGNIFQLGWPPHVAFAKLANQHGPIMTLWLGSMCTVVISSKEVAREMFKNHDVTFAGRKIYEAMKGNNGNEGSIITAQYGPKWRMLRRLCTSEFFVSNRLDAMKGVRKQCIDQMVEFVKDASGFGTNAIDIGRFFFLMAFNLIGNLMFSKDLLDPKSDRGEKFFYHAGKVMEFAGKSNVADFLPIFRRLDPQGIKRKTEFHIEQAFEIAGEFIKERIESMAKGKRKDFLDVLLEFRGENLDEPARRRNSVPKKLPPGPPGWPIIGNMFDLGSMPHRTLTNMREKYGQVIWLKLGTINTMAILSTKAATELFKNHDLSFAERYITETMRAHDYHKRSVALAPYGSYWRSLRRLVTVDMLVNKKINETAPIRRKCVDDMLQWIEDEEIKNQAKFDKNGIHVARFVFLLTFNLLGNLMLSRDLFDPDSKDGSEFFDAMLRFMELSGTGNIADFFPWLQWLDPQGLKRKMEKDLGKAIEIASKLVKQRIEEKKGKGDKKDFLDVLLEYEGNGKDEPVKLSDQELNIFILELFLAGSETTSGTIEWAFTELLCNPDTMIKAKAELTRVGCNNEKAGTLASSS
ncbi:Cytochrome P450 [Corchorus olitorius]|uniref:Cytochrome P450 n=1 Tax=Corchorus olitorius TaxID=93759 RepID=A0A1R3HD13_9ROSI|nr:Cytochrome P450 [Corchorus olitorius]